MNTFFCYTIYMYIYCTLIRMYHCMVICLYIYHYISNLNVLCSLHLYSLIVMCTMPITQQFIGNQLSHKKSKGNLNHDAGYQNDETSVVNVDIHPGRLTWNLQITHLERKMIFQTSIIMVHVKLQGCIPPQKEKACRTCKLNPSLEMSANFILPASNSAIGSRDPMIFFVVEYLLQLRN